MDDTAKLARKPDGGKPSRRPLVDDERHPCSFTILPYSVASNCPNVYADGSKAWRSRSPDRLASCAAASIATDQRPTLAPTSMTWIRRPGDDMFSTHCWSEDSPLVCRSLGTSRQARRRTNRAARTTWRRPVARHARSVAVAAVRRSVDMRPLTVPRLGAWMPLPARHRRLRPATARGSAALRRGLPRRRPSRRSPRWPRRRRAVGRRAAQS